MSICQPLGHTSYDYCKIYITFKDDILAVRNNEVLSLGIEV